MKGFIMYTLLIIVVLLIIYFTITHFTVLNQIPNHTSILAERIKDDLNDYYGNNIIMDASLEPVGLGYDDFEVEGAHQGGPVYLLSIRAIIGGRDKCISILLDDLSGSGLHIAMKGIIRKLSEVKNDLRVGCE